MLAVCAAVYIAVMLGLAVVLMRRHGARPNERVAGAIVAVGVGATVLTLAALLAYSLVVDRQVLAGTGAPQLTVKITAQHVCRRFARPCGQLFHGGEHGHRHPAA